MEDVSMEYIDKVKELLSKMSEDEKDKWILTQAKLISENKQKDFLQSLSGEKKIINMPSFNEINKFFEQVENCEIYFEYETHYYEFDDEGNYMDDWRIWYNDPFAITQKINQIIAGCHKLMCLEEYQTVYDLLTRLFYLQFFVDESEMSDDGPEDEFISLSNLNEKGMISEDIYSAGEIWMQSFLYLADKRDNKMLTHTLISMLDYSACKKLRPRNLVDYGVTNEVFSTMKMMLEEEISELEDLLNKESLENSESLKKYKIHGLLNKKQFLRLDIQLKCLKKECIDLKQNEFDLAKNWKYLNEIAQWLKHEGIDNQTEINTMIEICEAIIASSNIDKEDGQLRQQILKDIINHSFYNMYGLVDIMESVVDKLCTNQEEYLGYVDLLDATYVYKEKAAYLYYQYGNDDKYVSYLENHLGKACKEYNALITYYKEHGQEEDAKRIALQGLANCKDDLTEIFIFLLLDAEKQNDKKQFDKLYASAKRRKYVDIMKINQELQSNR